LATQYLVDAKTLPVGMDQLKGVGRNLSGGGNEKKGQKLAKNTEK